MLSYATEPESWQNLNFSQLYDQLPERNAQRRQLALKILHYLTAGQNVALDADTGTGKTIVAILVHLALGKKTLFLVPTVELAYQHRQLYEKLLGHTEGVKIMTGNLSPANRCHQWQEKNFQLVIATPQTILKDLERNCFPRGYFRFLVIDEFHHAHHRYAYVPLAEKAHRAGVTILSLSATADDLLALKNCFVDRVIKANIKMPRKVMLTAVAQTNDQLQTADQFCQRLIAVTAEELADLRIISPGDTWLSQHQLKKAEELARQLKHPASSQALSALGRYRALAYLRYLLNLCSYENFLAVADGLYGKSEKYAEWLVNHQLFNDLVVWVRHLVKDKQIHPKVKKFIEISHNQVKRGDIFIAFVNEKDTGRYLAEQLLKEDIKVKTAFGGPERKHLKILRCLMESGNLHGVIASSVLAEGMALPRVDTVINYGRPATKVEWKQRAGRAGRGDQPGTIITVILDYPQEWAQEKKNRPATLTRQLPPSETGWLFSPEEILPSFT